MPLTRRSLFLGIAPALLAAPAIVRAASLMKVSALKPLWGRGIPGSAEIAALNAAANARMQAMVDAIMEAEWKKIEPAVMRAILDGSAYKIAYDEEGLRVYPIHLDDLIAPA